MFDTTSGASGLLYSPLMQKKKPTLIKLSKLPLNWQYRISATYMSDVRSVPANWDF